jgi:hypothetical protein
MNMNTLTQEDRAENKAKEPPLPINIRINYTGLKNRLCTKEGLSHLAGLVLHLAQRGGYITKIERGKEVILNRDVRPRA